VDVLSAYRRAVHTIECPTSWSCWHSSAVATGRNR